MASAAHETHVATNTARSSATAPIVPLTPSDQEAALQVPQFSTAAASQGDVKVFDILLSEENPAMSSAAHETHVATNTARSSVIAPIVPLTRFGSL